MNNEMKLNQKSIRISDTVYNYIMSFEGDNFNDKLNNIFIFFMRTEEEKRGTITRLNEHIAIAKNEYDELCNCIGSLRETLKAADRFQERFEKYQADLDKILSVGGVLNEQKIRF